MSQKVTPYEHQKFNDSREILKILNNIIKLNN